MSKRTEETMSLEEELEQFKSEKEKIRSLVGQIGGKDQRRIDALVNTVFFTGITGLFLVDLARHVFHLSIPFPTMLSLELGILMVSLKIIWMMHKQAKVEHFQFWILNSIEFRLNDIAKRMRNIEQDIDYIIDEDGEEEEEKIVTS